MNETIRIPFALPLLLFKPCAFRINQPSMTESFDKPKILEKEFKMFWWSSVQKWLSCWPKNSLYLRPVKFWTTAAHPKLLGEGADTYGDSDDLFLPGILDHRTHTAWAAASARCARKSESWTSAQCQSCCPWLRTRVLKAAVLGKSDATYCSQGLDFSSGSSWWQV